MTVMMTLPDGGVRTGAPNPVRYAVDGWTPVDGDEKRGKNERRFRRGSAATRPPAG
jgi:hypothetical protein